MDTTLNEDKTPSEAIFEDMKKAALEVWNTYNNEYGYVTEKTDRVNSIVNYQDNAMVFYRMFDIHNQAKMRAKLKEEALEYILNNS